MKELENEEAIFLGKITAGNIPQDMQNTITKLELQQGLIPGFTMSLMSVINKEKESLATITSDDKSTVTVLYKDGTSEVFSASLQTGDRASKDISKQKHLEYLHYDINTGGKDVILTFYVDGVAQSPVIILNHSTRTRDRISLPQFQGYRFSLKMDCADAQNLYIYSPWIVTGTLTGD